MMAKFLGQIVQPAADCRVFRPLYINVSNVLSYVLSARAVVRRLKNRERRADLR